MSFDLGSLLSQFTGGSQANTADASSQFQQVAQAASPGLLGAGLAAMFSSDRTPAFGQMAGQLFGQASPGQQAGMLNEMLSHMGPAAMSALPAGVAGSLGGLLSQVAGGTTTLTPAQATQITPDQVAQMASHAEQHSPGIIEKMSGFYAQHPGLVKTLGGAALSIALAKMSETHRA
jgi:hypothetical protein